MDTNLPFHVKMFNDRVRAMNQSNGKILTLNQQEARNLHSEIYDLMAIIAELSKGSVISNNIEVGMDGGYFK